MHISHPKHLDEQHRIGWQSESIEVSLNMRIQGLPLSSVAFNEGRVCSSVHRQHSHTGRARYSCGAAFAFRLKRPIAAKGIGYSNGTHTRARVRKNISQNWNSLTSRTHTINPCILINCSLSLSLLLSTSDAVFAFVPDCCICRWLKAREYVSTKPPAFGILESPNRNGICLLSKDFCSNIEMHYFVCSLI